MMKRFESTHQAGCFAVVFACNFFAMQTSALMGNYKIAVWQLFVLCILTLLTRTWNTIA
jgi:hypothetical protein